MNKISSQDYCRNFVRDNNYNLYLLSFFVPRAKRPAILAIMALHTELRLIPKKVHDPMTMIIRLKWWHDEINKILSGLPHADSPILNEISRYCPTVNFDDYFNRIQQSMRGHQVDIEESLYMIFGEIIDNEKDNNRFSKRLCLHDELTEKSKFRALRLWLCK